MLTVSPQGTIGFEQHIDKCLDLSQYLYNKIKNREGYEMVFDGVVSFSLAGENSFVSNTLNRIFCVSIRWIALCSLSTPTFASGTSRPA